MNMLLPRLICVAGAGQLAVLIASALVPIRLRWRREFCCLSRLHRQLYWVYGGYVVLSIVALGLISLLNAGEMASGSRLARCVCAYIALFWTVRLGLQAILDVKQHLTAWWLRLGYHVLTILFASFAGIFAYAALFATRF